VPEANIISIVQTAHAGPSAQRRPVVLTANQAIA
jgi:hypothetical protein